MVGFYDYLQNHPWAAATFVAVVVIASGVEYVVRRRRGTWRPVRERPLHGGPALRYASVAVMLCAAALGVWQLVAGVTHDRPGQLIMGAFLTGFSLWVVWMGLVRGRDAA